MRMKGLAVIVPSRGRPNNIRRLAEAFARTESDSHPRLIVCIDEDDPERYGYVSQADQLVIRGRMRLVPWINHQSAEILVEEDPPSIIGFMGDDHLPRTPGWPEKIEAAMEAMGGTGIVYGNDLLQREKLPTAAFLSADIIRCLGYMAPPALVHMYVDNFWLDLGRAIKRIRYLPQVVIEHLHPFAGKAEMDASYATTTPLMEQDRIAYEGYKRERFDQDVAKLKAMIAG